jgi:hypothetical protein
MKKDVAPIDQDSNTLAGWILRQPTMSVADLARILEGWAAITQLEQAGVTIEGFLRNFEAAS